MIRVALTIFGLFFTASALAADNNWDPRTTASQQLKRFYPGVSPENMQTLREAILKSNPGFVPKTNILMVGGVRTSTGGGGAIACFDNDEIAYASFDTASRRFIPGREYLIRRMYTFDAYMSERYTKLVKKPEFTGGFRKDFRAVRDGETPWTYIMRILNENLRPVNSDFAQRLEKALIKVEPVKWLPHPSPPVLEDTGQLTINFKIANFDKPDCPVGWYVQLVNRIELPDKVITDANYKLMLRMRETWLASSYPDNAVIQEALLIVHEAVYLMAMQKGFWDSDIVRIVAANLLSGNLKAAEFAKFNSF